jgi:hypothetical protein
MSQVQTGLDLKAPPLSPLLVSLVGQAAKYCRSSCTENNTTSCRYKSNRKCATPSSDLVGYGSAQVTRLGVTECQSRLQLAQR